jgi:NTE family protein
VSEKTPDKPAPEGEAPKHRGVAHRLRDIAARVHERTHPPPEKMKTVNLALQGGGAHGAFTWGVLDALLEDERMDFEAISGTSAGAMNAVVLADGLMRDGAEGARHRLGAFWRRVSQEGAGSGAASEVLQQMLGFWHMQTFSPFAFFEQFSNLVSPYRTNPLNINPLRDLIAHLIDFDHVRDNDGLKLFISATNVRTGKIKVFSGKEVTADAVMASACLPYLFQAVEVDGEAYWDGGYAGNPALFPFFDATEAEDILVVQVNPVRREEIPHTSQEIMERASEITFNASLLREFRAIDFVNRLLDEHRLDPKRYRRNRVHRIDATAALAQYSAATKLDTSWHFFQELHKAGVKAGKDWLAAHYDDIGVKSTLDLRGEFG